MDYLLTIVYIGNIGHLYDFETLLSSLQSEQDKVRFFIVGDGDRRDWLLSELKSRKLAYNYFGIIYDDNELSEILSQCDYGFNGYINTSASFSYKANTYFSAGLPILNSMGGDLHDLILKHRLGFNYTPGNVESLTDCIRKCMSSDLLKMSSNVNIFFDSELDQDVIKNEMVIYLDKLLHDKGFTDEAIY